MSQQDYINRRAEALSKKRTEAERARLLLNEMDLSNVINLIFSYQKGESAESAVFILAQCQALLKPHRDLCNTIKSYERERDMLDRIAIQG